MLEDKDISYVWLRPFISRTQQLQLYISLIPGPTQSYVFQFALIHGSRRMAGKACKHSSHERCQVVDWIQVLHLQSRLQVL